MNLIAWVDPSFALRFTTALFHFLWQGCALGAVVFLGTFVLQPSSARLRYAFHVSALLAMAACLPATLMLLDHLEDPSTAVGQLPDHASNAAAPLGEPAIGSAGVMTPVPATASASGVADDKAAADPGKRSAASLFLGFIRPIAPHLTSLYFVCAALMLARLAKGVWGGHRLRQSASVIHDEKLLAMARGQAQRIGLRFSPVLAYCTEISVPVVIGIVKPMILLPAALASGLEPEQLRALITHELAHIRRYDLVVNLLQRIVESVLFFHPAVWYVSRRVSIEREHATDDMVVAAGWPRPRYADALVRMAELSRALRDAHSAGPVTALAASGISGSEFKRRVLRLLDGAEATPLRLTRSGTAILVMLLILSIGAPIAMHAVAQSTDAATDSRNPITAAQPAADTLAQADTLSEPSNGDQDKQARGDEQRSPANSKKPAAEDSDPAPAAKGPQELNFVLTEHVILHDGKIVTWDQVGQILDEAARNGKVYPRFHSTIGALAREEELRTHRWELYKKLYDVGKVEGMSVGSLSPRASERLDRIKNADDLVPDEANKISGQVLDVEGKPLAGVEVFLLPESHVNGVYLRDGKVRNPFEEHLTRSAEGGRFDIYPLENEELITAVHPNGFVIMPLDEFRQTKQLRLKRWARVAGDRPAAGDDAKQEVSFTCYPVEGISFHIYETEIAEDGSFEQPYVPPGKVTVQRSLPKGQGRSISYPVEVVELAPGELHRVSLGPIPDSAERQQSRVEPAEQPNSIDRTMTTRLAEQQALRTAEEKAMAAFFRRLHFDLVGIPVSTAALRDFVNASPTDRATAVNSLLATAAAERQWDRAEQEKVRGVLFESLLGLDQ